MIKRINKNNKIFTLVFIAILTFISMDSIISRIEYCTLKNEIAFNVAMYIVKDVLLVSVYTFIAFKLINKKANNKQVYRSVVPADFEFNWRKFRSVRHEMYFKKPIGGFWSCPYTKGQTTAWENWCAEETPEWLENTKYFDFTISDDANVLTLNSREDLEVLAETHAFEIEGLPTLSYLKWSKIAVGYDAIIFTEKLIQECKHDIGYTSTSELDVESICICNPDIIENLN
ncbi:MAG: hypothetical protein ACRCX8_10240 [Sarcina sp.]